MRAKLFPPAFEILFRATNKTVILRPNGPKDLRFFGLRPQNDVVSSGALKSFALPWLLFVLMFAGNPSPAAGKIFEVDGYQMEIPCEEGLQVCHSEILTAAGAWNESCTPTKTTSTECLPTDDPCYCKILTASVTGIYHTTTYEGGEKESTLTFCCSTVTLKVDTRPTDAPGCKDEPECGNGILENGEECEMTPRNEGGKEQTVARCQSGKNGPAPQACVACQCVAASCGDGIVQPPDEECEPPDKKIGGGYFCDQNCRKVEEGFCGDGIVGNSKYELCEPSKENERVCDDKCQWEYPVCGDGKWQIYELCDWNGNIGDCPPGQLCNKECNGCQPSLACGNGTADPGEGCDDGNTADGDGCSSACQVESADCANTLGYGYQDDPCNSDRCQEITPIIDSVSGTQTNCYRCANPTFTCCGEEGRPGTFGAYAGDPSCPGGCTALELNCSAECPPGFMRPPPQNIYCCRYAEEPHCTAQEERACSNTNETCLYCAQNSNCSGTGATTLQSGDCAGGSCPDRLL